MGAVTRAAKAGRAVVLGVLVSVAVVALAAPAGAHPAFEPGRPATDGTTSLVLPHGCAGDGVVPGAVELQLELDDASGREAGRRPRAPALR